MKVLFSDVNEVKLPRVPMQNSVNYHVHIFIYNTATLTVIALRVSLLRCVATLGWLPMCPRVLDAEDTSGRQQMTHGGINLSIEAT